MATTVVPTSFKVLVKMVASAFYGGMCPPLEALPPEERERAQKPQVRRSALVWGRAALWSCCRCIRHSLARPI